MKMLIDDKTINIVSMGPPVYQYSELLSRWNNQKVILNQIFKK
jgi:hypothetical protein